MALHIIDTLRNKSRARLENVSLFMIKRAILFFLKENTLNFHYKDRPIIMLCREMFAGYYNNDTVTEYDHLLDNG